MPPAVTNPSDQASRGLLRRAPLLLPWLLRVLPAAIRFERWIDTRLSLPDHPERVCDTIAHVWREDEGGYPWAIPVEFQAAPDSLMFGRAMGYLSMIWTQEKPTEHAGDRFHVVCVVVNLTGVGNCGRRMAWRSPKKSSKSKRKPRVVGETACVPIEWNVETLDARLVMRQVASGTAPLALLALISLMKNGDDPVILQRWPELAERETDPLRKADLALVVVFADLTGRTAAWEKALEGFNVIESPTVNKWTAEAATKAAAKAAVQTRITDTLNVLSSRFGPVPAELRTKIEGAEDADVLSGWLISAATVETLDHFRQACGK